MTRISRATARAAFIAIGSVCFALALVAALPAILHSCGLSLIPEERLAIEISPVPNSAVAVFWASVGGTGEPALERRNPYSFLLELVLSAREGAFAEVTASERLTVLASHTILPRGTQIAGGMGSWHLARAAASIWAGRHWSAREAIAAFLNDAYFGNEFLGLEAAASGYFGAPVRQLSEEQLAMLMVAAHSPQRRDPWCHPEENVAAARDIVEKLGRGHTRPLAKILPAPSGACQQ